MKIHDDDDQTWRGYWVEWFVLSSITDETGDNDDGVCRSVFFALDDADANVDFD